MEEEKTTTAPGDTNEKPEEQALSPDGAPAAETAQPDIFQTYSQISENAAGVVNGTVCAVCGSEIEAGREFCPNCGQKTVIGEAAETFNGMAQIDPAAAANAKKKKKKKTLICIISAAVAVVVALALMFILGVFTSVEKLCAQGNYEKAYNKASGEEKLAVLAENVTAYNSNETSNSMKDPSSFELRDAYYYASYDEEEDNIFQNLVLYVGGKNSYGGIIGNYWLWSATERGNWKLMGTCSSLSLDEDDDDYLVSLLCKATISVDNSLKLSSSAVDNINRFFKEGALDNVSLIEYSKIDTSVIPKS